MSPWDARFRLFARGVHLPAKKGRRAPARFGSDFTAGAEAGAAPVVSASAKYLAEAQRRGRISLAIELGMLGMMAAMTYSTLR